MISSFALDGHIVGVVLDRDLNDESLAEIISIINKKLESHKSLNVYIELQKDCQVEFKAFMNGVIYKYSNASKFDKLAIVTNLNWFKNAVKISDIFLDVEVRTFENKERLDAINWISQ